MKKIIPLLLTGVSLAVTPSALAAAAVQVSGGASIKYERDTAAGVADETGSVGTITLKGEADLGSGWGAYARVGVQHATNPALADFNVDAYSAGKKTVIGVDQFGFTYQNGGFTYKLGRQDAAVGSMALLYSRPESNLGKHQFVDGISARGISGKTELFAIAAREDNAGGNAENSLYAIRAGYNPSTNLQWGVTLGRYNSDTSTNHWAVDSSYKLGKSAFTAAYTRSSSGVDNRAYGLGWNYELDGKTAVSVTGFRVENNGSMGGQSDFDAGNRGIHYGVSRKINDSVSLELTYKDQKSINLGEKNSKLEVTMSHSF